MPVRGAKSRSRSGRLLRCKADTAADFTVLLDKHLHCGWAKTAHGAWDSQRWRLDVMIWLKSVALRHLSFCRKRLRYQPQEHAIRWRAQESRLPPKLGVIFGILRVVDFAPLLASMRRLCRHLTFDQKKAM
ncbi:hypothetical protein FALCPG4_010407 [Fusarium falciforme]